MGNLFSEFLKLIPSSPTIVCSVVIENADGTTRVVTLDNQPLIVQGTGNREFGNRVFVKDGRIVDDAPTLPVTSYEV